MQVSSPLYSSRNPAMITRAQPGVRVLDLCTNSPIICNLSTALSFAIDFIPGFREVNDRNNFNINIFLVDDIKAYLHQTEGRIFTDGDIVYAATTPMGTPALGIRATNTYIDKDRLMEINYPEKILSTILHEAALITYFANVSLQDLKRTPHYAIERQMFETHIHALEEIIKSDSSPYSKSNLEAVLEEERLFAAFWENKD